MKYKIFTSPVTPEIQAVLDIVKIMNISIEEDVFGFTAEDYKSVIDDWIQSGNVAICIDISDDDNIYGLNENVIFLDDNYLERFLKIVNKRETKLYKFNATLTTEDMYKMLGYLLYTFHEYGLLSKRGWDILFYRPNDNLTISDEIAEEIFDTIHLPFRDIEEFGEVL